MARQKKSVKMANNITLRRRPSSTGKVPKVRKTVDNDETCLQMHAWAWVSKTYPDLLIFHVANERQAAVQYHVKLKRLGVLKGTADFLAFPSAHYKAAIELKDDEGEQDKDQKYFQKRWERAGGVYFLVRTLEDFKIIVTALMIFG